MTSSHDRQGSFSVLVVCTANRYRSPLAEHMLRAAAHAAGLRGWTIGSAGTNARAGEPLDPVVAAILAQRKIETGRWTSRRLTPALIERSDLVLAADASHRRAVVTASAAALPKTFLLRQFARMSAALPTIFVEPPMSGPDLVSAVTLGRAHLQPVRAEDEGVADPAGRRRRVLRATSTLIEQAVLDIVRAVDTELAPH